MSNLIKSNWLHGPTFLWEKHEAWDTSFDVVDEEAKALIRKEMRKATVFSIDVSEPNLALLKLDINRLDHISCWYKPKRCTANCLKLKDSLMRKVKRASVSENDNELSTSDFMRAEKEILRSCQLENFNEQFLALLENDSQDNTRQNHTQKKITL